MRIACFLLFFSLVININTFAQSQDTLSHKKNNKAKAFFSLKDTNIVRERNAITFAADSYPSKSIAGWHLNCSGLIGFDVFWDTRKPVEARDGGIYLYPTDVFFDKNGKDINARGSFNFCAMNTRLTLGVQAPDALGAKISGMVEGWFMGISNSDMNGFALRHAFIKTDWISRYAGYRDIPWKSTQLLLGQTWHPLFTEKMFAHTVAGSAGAPFQPFARVPQIRVTQEFGKNSTSSSGYASLTVVKRNYLLAYLNAQRDLLSFGPSGVSSDYLRQSMLPEMGVQYIFDAERIKRARDLRGDLYDGSEHQIYTGLGVNFKRIVPRLITADTLATKKGLNSYSGIAFFHYEYKPIDIYGSYEKMKAGFKLKAVFMQNSYEYLMIGGYAIKEYDAYTPLDLRKDFEYTNLNTLSFWGDLYLNYHSWEVGIFGGYCKNLGAFHAIQASNDTHSYYARAYNADFMYRVSTRLKYTANKLQFCLEPEYTAAAYGTSLTSTGKVNRAETTHWVHNLRVLVSMVLYF